MVMGSANRSDRLKAAAPVVLIHVGLGVMILSIAPPLVLSDPPLRIPSDSLVMLPPPVPEETPPPVLEHVRPDPDPRRPADPREEGASAPPNIRSTPTPIVAPERIVSQPVPTPITAAPLPDIGFNRSAGAAPVPGPGTGAGGIGNGRGSGAGGDGTGSGGGGGGGGFSPPRHIRGSMRNSDFPRDIGEAGISGTVGVRYVVMPDGSVGDCIVEESSGSRALDDLTCRLIQQRFRFEPSRDRSGRPVRSQIVENHSWDVIDLPPERRIERRRRRGLF